MRFCKPKTVVGTKVYLGVFFTFWPQFSNSVTGYTFYTYIRVSQDSIFTEVLKLPTFMIFL